MFSPWQFNIDKASRALLEESGWQMPDPGYLPTGGEIIDEYLAPLANLAVLKPHIRYQTRVTAVGRKGFDKMKSYGRDNKPFIIYAESTGDGKTESVTLQAKAVIDASGTWKNPNPIGSGGLPAAGEKAFKDHIFYGIPDIQNKHRQRFAGKRIMVIGSGHSAINALLELEPLVTEAPGTEIIWAVRKTNIKRAYGGQENDALPARGALGSKLREMVESGSIDVASGFRIQELQKVDGKISVIGESYNEEKRIDRLDEIVATTGARPDLSLFSELRISLDPAVESTPAMAPLIDPNIHSCGTVRPHGEEELRHPEKDFYIVGMKSYGRAPTFLLATGYEQVRSVVAALTGDMEAAKRVELELPQTGVCSSDFEAEAAACCGSPEEVPAKVEVEMIESAPDSCCGSSEVPAAVESSESAACCGNDVETAENGAGSACCEPQTKEKFLQGEIAQSDCCG